MRVRTGGPVRVSSVEDLQRLGLVTLTGLTSYWAQVHATTYLAVAARYPLGEFGARRVVDVDFARASAGSPDGQGKAERLPGDLAMSCGPLGGELRPHILISRDWFGRHTRRHALAGLREQIDSGYVPWVRHPERLLILHEYGHEVFRTGEDCSGFIGALSRAVGGALGVDWRPGLHWSGGVQRAVAEQLGTHAQVNADEFFADAFAAGVLDGDDAPPVARAVREVVDRRFRFDAPGSRDLAEQVRAEYETTHHASATNAPSRTRAQTGDLRKVAAWDYLPVENRGGVGAPPWMPMTFTGVTTGEGALVVHPASHRDRDVPYLPVRKFPGDSPKRWRGDRDLRDTLQGVGAHREPTRLSGAATYPVVSRRVGTLTRAAQRPVRPVRS